MPNRPTNDIIVMKGRRASRFVAHTWTGVELLQSDQKIHLRFEHGVELSYVQLSDTKLDKPAYCGAAYFVLFRCERGSACSMLLTG